MISSVRARASAVEALRRIRRQDRWRLVHVVDWLAAEPEAGGLLEGGHDCLRSIRVGKYRIVYEARDGQVVVMLVRLTTRAATC